MNIRINIKKEAMIELTKHDFIKGRELLNKSYINDHQLYKCEVLM